MSFIYHLRSYHNIDTRFLKVIRSFSFKAIQIQTNRIQLHQTGKIINGDFIWFRFL